MKTTEKYIGKTDKPSGANFFPHFWEKSWTYVKTVVDVLHESVVILDANLKVVAANEAFYQTFQAKPEDTEGEVIYKLGNGQWDIPVLRKLLEDILPKQTVFKGFQVAHEFPSIGRKVMILNARQIYIKDDEVSEEFPPIILLAIEDVTEMMVVAESLSGHAKDIESKLMARSQKLEILIGQLEKEISELKNKPDRV
ncbi:MAG: PAS domain-containing protein [bacterium]|nr:PAS domain-containing protein [bacterium]